MLLSFSDIVTGTVAIVIIAIAAGWLKLFTSFGKLTPLNGRKLLHITAICTCAWAISRFENRLALAYIFLLSFFLLLWAVQKGFMQVGEKKSYGIALFPLAFFVLLVVPVFPLKQVVFAVLVLGISDAAAGWVGSNYAKKHQIFWREEKSWTGFAAFFIATVVLAFFYYGLVSVHGVLFACCLAIVPALTELFSYKGSDNFSVPIAAAVWNVLIASMEASSECYVFLLLLVLLILLAAAAVYKKWLTQSGAAAALWMGCIFFATGGWQVFAAPVLFLVSGSLLSKLNKDSAEPSGRNGVQVLANGLVATICLLLYGLLGQPVFFTAAIVSFCISMADSTSSELGRYFGGKTVDIINFKQVKAGLSGGISLAGTVAGLAGAAVLALIAGLICNFSIMLILLIMMAGFGGMLADSILGSWLQAKYQTADGFIKEKPGPGALRLKGFAWCGNDAVNILANAVVTAIIILIILTFAYTPQL
jgi:uncharacterized protein (TIGR00297 family)